MTSVCLRWQGQFTGPIFIIIMIYFFSVLFSSWSWWASPHSTLQAMVRTRFPHGLTWWAGALPSLPWAWFPSTPSTSYAHFLGSSAMWVCRPLVLIHSTHCYLLFYQKMQTAEYTQNSLKVLFMAKHLYSRHRWMHPIWLGSINITVDCSGIIDHYLFCLLLCVSRE